MSAWMRNKYLVPLALKKKPQVDPAFRVIIREHSALTGLPAMLLILCLSSPINPSQIRYKEQGSLVSGIEKEGKQGVSFSFAYIS